MDTKPWWQSKTIWGALIATIATVLKLFKVNVDLPPDLGDQILNAVTLVGTLFAIYGRMKARAVISSAPAPTNPNSPLMRICVIGAICGSLVFSGCQTALPSNATAAQKAQAAIDTATTGAKFVIAPAVTAFLLLQKDPVKRQQDAAYVYAGATALNSAATGAIPTQTELQALIATFVKPDPRYADLAQLLASEYGTLYPLFKVAGTSPVKFLAEVALQAQNAAKPFLAPPQA